MDRRLLKPSVRRCLFDRTSNTDESVADFMKKQKKIEEEEAKRFKRKWNFDEIQWTKPEANEYIPEFYTKGYSQKCRRRALMPCIGKRLSFEGSDCEDSCKDVNEQPSSVQYTCAASTVEVFIGLLPHRSPEESSTTPVTPKSDGSHSTTKSENSNSDVCLKKFKQKRLTEVWPVVKRPRPQQTSEQLPKRARIDRL